MRTPIRLQKIVGDLNEIWYVGRGWRVTVCDMTRTKVKVTKVWNVQKWPISKSISSTNMHVIKRLVRWIVMGLLYRQYVNFNCTDFPIFLSSFGVTWPTSFRCSNVGHVLFLWNLVHSLYLMSDSDLDPDPMLRSRRSKSSENSQFQSLSPINQSSAGIYEMKV